MQDEARCVIVGGGAMGVGLLYHLAHEGWTDTVLIDKDELTSGATWHAAGLIPHFIGSLNMAKVHAYGVKLYGRHSRRRLVFITGWHGCGAVRLAVTEDETDWFRYVHGVLSLVGDRISSRRPGGGQGSASAGRGRRRSHGISHASRRLDRPFGSQPTRWRPVPDSSEPRSNDTTVFWT